MFSFSNWVMVFLCLFGVATGASETEFAVSGNGYLEQSAWSPISKIGPYSVESRKNEHGDDCHYHAVPYEHFCHLGHCGSILTPSFSLFNFCEAQQAYLEFANNYSFQCMNALLRPPIS